MNCLNSKKALTLLKSLLIIQTLLIITYTTFIINLSGSNFIKTGIENILALGWNGQFTLDFSCYLFLVSLWILWRNKYSFYSFLLSLVAFTMGIIFFAPYIFFLIVKEKGDISKVMIGDR